MSAPEVVVLDTRGTTDKAGFLAAAGKCLGFPAYSGSNWDAFEESLRDFVRDRAPVLVVWTGASELGSQERVTALEIMNDCFTDGADLLIIDDVATSAQPDFALDSVTVTIPAGSGSQARTFWTDVIGLRAMGDELVADAISVRLQEDSGFQPGVSGPTIMVRDVTDLLTRLRDAGHQVEVLDGTDGRGFSTLDPFGNCLRFVAF